jgi:hypothetical protein
MGLLDIATSFFRRGGGFWGYMTERTKSRTAIELERERNAATKDVIPMLKPGIDFMETEEGGRTRVIRYAPLPQGVDASSDSATGASLSPHSDRTSSQVSPQALGPGISTGPLTLPSHQGQDDHAAGERTQ